MPAYIEKRGNAMTDGIEDGQRAVVDAKRPRRTRSATPRPARGEMRRAVLDFAIGIRAMALGMMRCAVMWCAAVRLAGNARLVVIGIWGLALNCAFALDLDPSFGAAGRGYVPVSNAEPQTDTAAALVRQIDDKFVVLGTRTTNGRGVLLLQRYGPDGTFDAFYGQFGTLTIDMPGVSLTAKQLFLEPDGSVRAVADTADGLRVFAVTASGQVDNTFGPGGSALIPYAPGVPQGTTSVHLLDDGRLLAISQNAPAGSGALTVSRYRTDGPLDDNFGLNGKQPVPSVGAGLTYTGVGAIMTDGRLALVLAGSDGASRAIMILDNNGFPDNANAGKPVFPAALQGKTITRLVPLFSDAMIAVASTGTGTPAQATTLVRLTSSAATDPTFGSGGAVAVEIADSGGGVAINQVYETPDNYLVLTGASNNGLVVARYVAQGTLDPTFANGKATVVVAEPGSKRTIGVASLQYPHGVIVHLGYGVLYGATAGGASPARAFVVSTDEGVLDVNYASQGILNLFGRTPPNTEFVQHVQPLPDGRVLVLSSTGVGAGLTATLSRYNADGSLDATYGAKGRSTFVVNGRCEWPIAMNVQGDGSVLLLGTSFDMIDCDTSAMFGKRFDASGADTRFQLIFSGTNRHGRSGDVAVQADGRIVVTGQDDGGLVVARFFATGAPDAAFGTGGSVVVRQSAADDAKGGALLIRGGQKILAAGAVNGNQLMLVQLNPDGSRDAAFGSNGVATMPVTGTFLEVYQVSATPGGKLLVLARSGSRPLLAQFLANGAPDASFGFNGQLAVPLFIGGAAQYARFGMALQADGAILVSGQSQIDTSSEVALVRVTPGGQLDASFGPGGMVTWRPSIYYPAGATALATTAGGLYVAGYGIPGAFLARFGSSATPASVVEFYNTQLLHYFITADPAEQTAVDNGAAGPGWTRTGLGFHAYTPALGIPVGVVPVCRFYGSTAINPATGQRRGPNSHFYTADAAECATVQLDAGWTLEGFAFYITLPVGGQCPTGLVPVYRAYNERAAFNDSNHRYTTDVATYQQMIAMGWAGEGVVFCSSGPGP
jgi:uncharacterized delta-60 repeat protein